MATQNLAGRVMQNKDKRWNGLTVFTYNGDPTIPGMNRFSTALVLCSCVEDQIFVCRKFSRISRGVGGRG